MATSVALEARHLGLSYQMPRSRSMQLTDRLLRRRPPKLLMVVHDASLEILDGRCVGIVGESGSGKTTLANCLAGLTKPQSGEVMFGGVSVSSPTKAPQMPRARGIQMIFQDPYSSLNPRLTVHSVLEEILRVHRLRDNDKIEQRISELLLAVGLTAAHATAYPRNLSGGQRQRVAIARALAFEPVVIIADEIVSALDASVQAQILNLLSDLRRDLALTIVFITHDFAVVRQICDEVAVMKNGNIVEYGTTDSVLGNPQDPYTQQLLGAVPRLSRNDR